MQITGNNPLHFDVVTDQLDPMLQLGDIICKHTVMQAVPGRIATPSAVGLGGP